MPPVVWQQHPWGAWPQYATPHQAPTLAGHRTHNRVQVAFEQQLTGATSPAPRTTGRPICDHCGSATLSTRATRSTPTWHRQAGFPGARSTITSGRRHTSHGCASLRHRRSAVVHPHCPTVVLRRHNLGKTPVLTGRRRAATRAATTTVAVAPTITTAMAPAMAVATAATGGVTAAATTQATATMGAMATTNRLGGVSRAACTTV